MATPALFLDRDGVMNVDKHYVHKSCDFEWMPGIVELIQRFKAAGCLVIVVTNQSGIARGYFSIEEFGALTQWMTQVLADRGASIDDVFFCPHHPIKGQGEYLTSCDCRKPQPGMIYSAQRKHNIDLQNSTMIGNSLSDIQAAVAANIGRVVFIQGKRKDEHFVRSLDTKCAIDIVQDLDVIKPR